VASVSATAGHEFFVDLRATAGFSAVDEETYYRKRAELLRQCVAGDGATAPAIRTGGRQLHHRVWREVSRVGRQLHILPKAS
jgi:hypothetical protein